MKTTAIGMIGLMILAGGLSARTAPSISARNGEVFTGEITDSLCAQDHHMGIFKSAKNCILTCVKSDGAQFVLYNFKTNRIYNLDDQLQPEAFAGQEVIVFGTYDKEGKDIHVIQIRPKIIYAGL